MGRPCICCGKSTGCGCRECVKDLNVDNYEYALIITTLPYTGDYGETYLNEHYLGYLSNDSASQGKYTTNWYYTSETIKDEILKYNDSTYSKRVSCPPANAWQVSKDWSLGGSTGFLWYRGLSANGGNEYFNLLSNKDPFTYARFWLKTGLYGESYKPTVEMAMNYPELPPDHIYSGGLKILRVSIVRMNKQNSELCVIFDGDAQTLEYGSFLGGERGIVLGDEWASVYQWLPGYQPFCCDCKGKRYKSIVVEVSGVEDTQYLVKYNPNDSQIYKPYIVSGDLITGCSNFNGSYVINFDTFLTDYHLANVNNPCFGALSPGTTYAYTGAGNGYIEYIYNLGLRIRLPRVYYGPEPPSAFKGETIFGYFSEIHNLLCHSNPIEFHLYQSGVPTGNSDRFHYFVPVGSSFGGYYVYENGYIAQSRNPATIKIYGVE